MNLIDMVHFITKLTYQSYQLVSYLLPSWIRYVYLRTYSGANGIS